MSQFKRAATIYCVFERNERTVNSIRERRTDHVDLRCLRSQILFLLRTLSLADDMTKRARMCAIKRLSNRLAQRRVLRVINDHCRPCERLQSDPMQTNRETKCADRGDPASAAQHDCEARERPDQSQAIALCSCMRFRVSNFDLRFKNRGRTSRVKIRVIQQFI
jgi:hypothetical protein